MQEPTKQQYVRALAYWVGPTLGVVPEEIFDSRCRCAEVVDARRCIARLMLKTTKISIYEIAELLGQKSSQARMGKGMFKFNGEQEWLKDTALPFLRQPSPR
jgi:hypothetical protein